MKLRQLWKLLSGVAVLVAGFLLGAPASAGASTGGCAGDVVVALDVRVVNRPGQDTFEFVVPTPLGPGVWSVQAGSSDGYDGRAEVVQPDERWLVDFGAAGRLGPTSELPDGVDEAASIDDLGTIVVDAQLSRFTVRHALLGASGGPNSVDADCLAFTLVEAPGSGVTVDHRVDCDAGIVSVDIANAGRLPAAVVLDSAAGTTQVVVAAGSTHAARIEIVDASTSFVVSGPAGPVADVVVDTSCPAPPPVSTTTTTTTTVPPASTTTSVPPTTTIGPVTTTVPTRGPVRTPAPASIVAEASVDCAAAGVRVELANEGERDATVDVAIPRAGVRSAIVVAGGERTTTTIGIDPAVTGPREVRVSDSSSGDDFATVEVDVQCREPGVPVAAATLDCSRGAVIVELGNQGEAPVSMTVTHERVGAVGRAIVEGGDQVEFDVPTDGYDAVAVRVVTDDGTDVLRSRIAVTCGSPPSVPTTTLGTDGTDPEGGDGSGSNGGPATGACDVETLRPASRSAAGEPRLDLESGHAPIALTTGTPTLVATLASVGDCARVEISLQPDCAGGTVDVEIMRRGVGRERFVVLSSGAVGGVVSISGTGSGTLPVPTDDGAGISVVRSSVDSPIELGTLRCGGPSSRAGPVAASLVVLSALASVVGAIVWPRRRSLVVAPIE